MIEILKSFIFILLYGGAVYFSMVLGVIVWKLCLARVTQEQFEETIGRLYYLRQEYQDKHKDKEE